MPSTRLPLLTSVTNGLFWMPGEGQAGLAEREGEQSGHLAPGAPLWPRSERPAGRQQAALKTVSLTTPCVALSPQALEVKAKDKPCLGSPQGSSIPEAPVSL